MATLLNKPADGYTILCRPPRGLSFSMATKDNQHTPDEFTVLPALQSEPSAIAGTRADSRFKTIGSWTSSVITRPSVGWHWGPAFTNMCFTA